MRGTRVEKLAQRSAKARPAACVRAAPHAVERLEGRTLLATFVVTNPGDHAPGTLREAIEQSNFTPGPDTIVFDIFGGGPQTIAPVSPLPPIHDSVTIDATTQPGYSGNPLIELTGSAAPGGEGFRLVSPMSSHSVIRGFVINRWDRAGIGIQNNSENNLIVGNWIGLDRFGNVPVPNFQAGVLLQGAGPNNRIGGANPLDRNVISGNQNAGIQIDFTNDTVVLGNFIGTNVTGDAAVGNGLGLLLIESHRSVVGAPGPGEGNVISGNHGSGLLLVESDENLIHGNFVGTRADGTGAVPNFGFGIDVGPGSDLNSIGGPSPDQGNVLANNGAGGLHLLGNNNLVLGNSIGIDAANNPAGNNNHGITIEGSNNIVGGTGPNDPNRIAFNGGAGIAIVDGDENALRRNAIVSNGGLGIDLNPLAAPNPNDPQDPDEGPNDLQNFPVITAATTSGSSTTTHGTLNSTPNRTFVIELFANLAPDPSGHGEGEQFVGDVTVTTDAFGNATFAATFSAVPIGQVITATATEVSGNTSEFSLATMVVAPQPPPPPPPPVDDGDEDDDDEEDDGKGRGKGKGHGHGKPGNNGNNGKNGNNNNNNGKGKGKGK